MYDLAKMFLHCLNHWKLETPTARKQTMSTEDISAYKVITVNYWEGSKHKNITYKKADKYVFTHGYMYISG